MRRRFQFRLATLLWAMLVIGLTMAGLQQQAALRGLRASLSLYEGEGAEELHARDQFRVQSREIVSKGDLYLRQLTVRTSVAGRLELIADDDDQPAASIASGPLGGGPGLVELHLGAIRREIDGEQLTDQWMVMRSGATRVVTGAETRRTEDAPLAEQFVVSLQDGVYRCGELIPLGTFQGRRWSLRVLSQRAG